jgi:hypothetical protein
LLRPFLKKKLKMEKRPMPTDERPTGGANLRASLAPSTEKPKWPAAMAAST